MRVAQEAGFRNVGQAGVASGDAARRLGAEAVRLGRLLRRVMQEPTRLARAWLAASAAVLAGEDPRAAGLLERSVAPLCTSLCHARLADAELHVTELVHDLRTLAFQLAQVVSVLGALEQALAQCAPQADALDVLRPLGDFFLAIAAEVFERQDAGEAALGSHVRTSRAPQRRESQQSGVRPAVQASGAPQSELVGSSAALRQLRSHVAAVATAPGPVLIVGPSGTGKELVARAIHRLGSAASRPWLAVNCAALPHELIESELFGHERGAFTGSRGSAPGLMRAAEDGTLFLDEITEMPSATQAKLLRALEQRTVRPVGGLQEWPLRARVVAATNREPLAAIASGALRTDLFYRLCVHRIDVPALGQHAEDLPLLLQHFLELLARAGQQVPLGFSPRSLSVLQGYGWPGNVRELRNVVEHCCAFARDTWVELEHLPQHVLLAQAGRASGRALANTADDDLAPLHEVERLHIQRALRRAGGNKAQAARLLCVSRHQLYVRIERLGITDW
jgi:DNA-binding NtrC family response regulator